MRCLLKALILLHLVPDTAHAPSGVCPSKRYCTPCDERNVICTLNSSGNITDFLNFGPASMPVNKLTINGCSEYEKVERNLNVKSLELNCSNKRILQPYIPLFDLWSPYLETVANEGYVYTKSLIIGNKSCSSICSPNTVAPIKNSSLCICITRTRNDGDNSINTTLPTGYLNSNGSIGNNTSNVEKFNFYYLLAIGSVSLLTFVVNFVLMITMCMTHKTTVIDVFGFALMVFNIFLSLYGVALTVYISQNHDEWHQRFCQGFTSVKLFALGASVWTLLMLTYHRKVRGDIDEDDEDEKEHKERVKEEKEKKKKETDAIFKGIVYILEGLMLSGVLAVMSWIKLDRWGYLCIIFEPKTTVEWLLTGIELFYYFIAFCLLLRYPYTLIRKKRKAMMTKDRKKKKGKKKKDKSHTIFLMVFVCFVIWVTGYVMTLPHYGMFTDKLRRVIRVGALIFPLSIQPIIYIIRNTCCCLCRDPPCKRKREKEKQPTDHCVLLVCECTGLQKCPACESEYLEKYGNTQFNEKEANGGTQKKTKKIKQNKKDDKIKKKKKKRKNDIAEPKAIERSPILKQRDISFDDAVAETPLLENDDTMETEDAPLPSKSVHFPTDSTPLLDDTDGAKQPPRATPDSTPVKTIEKQNKAGTSEFPSFINMESAIDVDSLPKEKTSKISKLTANSKLLDDEGRKSRGPTFFPLAEKKNGVEERTKKKTKKKNEGEKNSKNNHHESGSKKLKRGKSKENKKDETSKVSNNERDSTISLEWDHYSDSSGSISRESDCFPDEMVVNKTSIDNAKQQNNCNHQNNGISTKKQEKETTECLQEEDLNKNTDDPNLVGKNKQKADLINQNSNGKVTSSL